MIAQGRYDQAIDRMARAAVRDSLPRDGMFNSDQLDHMASERMPTYRTIARVMLDALLAESVSSGDSDIGR
jgi:hypothetical protein